jgi:hypothetical protein
MNCKIFLILFVLISLNWKCSESPTANLKKFNSIKKDLSDNYRTNKADFTKLGFYFRLDHLKKIELADSQKLSVHYKIGTDDDTDEVKETGIKDINSLDILSVIKLDSLSEKELLELKQILSKLNVDQFSTIDYYDNLSGKFFKEIDLRYKKSMTGLTFFYRLFQEPISSLPSGTYGLLLNNDSTGGILDKNIIWYYR